MEFTIDAVANRIILIIICLSVLVAVGGVVFFQMHSSFAPAGAIPFMVGVAMAMVMNIIKILWLKKAINIVTNIQSTKPAQVQLQLHYFLRLVFTGLVLLAAILAPDNIVNFFGTVIGIFTLTAAMHILRLFIPSDAPMLVNMPSKIDPVQEAIDKMEAAIAEKEDE